MLPKVSICTPTFNRRPFIPYLIKCVENQTYYKELIEWIIIDDGTDYIEDLVNNIPYVTYIKLSNKLPLGEKRNLAHTYCRGDIIIYMDDDDYYPPQRVEHAVNVLLQNPDKLIAGATIMNIYFKHNRQMYTFGPYGENRITAATFAFRRELLESSRYLDTKCLGEEKEFLNNYKIPIAELETEKTILVISHIHNTFDKKELLTQCVDNPYIHLSVKTISDFIKDPELLEFYENKVDKELEKYNEGKLTNKMDVLVEKYRLENEMVHKEIKKCCLDLDNAIQQLNYMKQENDRLTNVNRLLIEKMRSYSESQVRFHKDQWKL
jgi:glycosyltransferase involved in cell wall biosynthesis